ncbi:MAG: metallophosphoesterase [Candidatus Heimdallarchaeota archaeon]|nr:metallophosphoesterase [Candidatus Heimdallarchaeota archaeon]
MKRTTLLFQVILIIFFSNSVFLNDPSNLIFAASDNNDLAPSNFTNYNATSSTEYFNESSHPRYSLASKPIDLITYPHKGYPEIIIFDEYFTILVNTTSDVTNWEFYLKSGSETVFLNILHKKYENDLWHFDVKPSINSAGLFDLQLNCSSGSDYQTHSVKVMEEKAYPFNFVHLSDTHFPSYDVYNTTDINLRNIAEIKELDIDFAIFTGDLINGPSWMFVDPLTQKPLAVEVGLKLALWAFDLLDLPVYIIAGNHDLDATTLVPDDPTTIWKKYLGENPVLNYSFLDWFFIGFGSSRPGLNTEEFNYLKSAVSSTQNSPNVLFYHSNYKEQASTLRNSYKIEVMLYGHEHHESLAVTDHTLYFCQAPLFYNQSTIFTVLNKTHLEMKGNTYDFTILLEEVTESSFILTLFSSMMLFTIVHLIIRKRKKNLSILFGKC